MTEDDRRIEGAGTVLVVDDDAWYRSSFEEALGQRGYRVAVAGHGADALAEAERVRPAATLLDLGAPPSLGIETLRALRKVGRGGMIIVLTAAGTLWTAREAMVLGAHDYVTKPIEPGLVELLLREGLEEQQAIRRAPGGARPSQPGEELGVCAA
jgi:DNA-binding response OmpR family regulator